MTFDIELVVAPFKTGSYRILTSASIYLVEKRFGQLLLDSLVDAGTDVDL